MLHPRLTKAMDMTIETAPSGPGKGKPLEPDAHGQAALILTESILHALVEEKVFTTGKAIAILRTASEVKVEVAVAAHESQGRMLDSLNLLTAITRSFATDRP